MRNDLVDYYKGPHPVTICSRDHIKGSMYSYNMYYAATYAAVTGWVQYPNHPLEFVSQP